MADVKQLQALLEDAEKLGAIRKAVGKLSGLLDKVSETQKELNKLIGGTAKKAKKKPTTKQNHPKPNTAPAKLCKVMSTKPKKAAAIAKAVGIKEATAKIYFGKFKCFSNVRGKGYIYTKPATAKKKTAKKKKSKKKS